MSSKPLDPHLWKLEDLFKPVYSVPVYQRPYSWDKEQIDVLLNDIFETYSSEYKNEGYYTGNIIVYDRNDKINGLITKYEIIDGQQRITTFALILMSIYTIARRENIDDSDRTLGNVKEALWKVVNREYQKDLPSISLNSIDKKCFTELYVACFEQPATIEDFCKNYNVTSKFDQRILNNFQIIYSFLEKSIMINSKNDLLDFADYILQYIQFIVIEASCKENKVFSMFESINSKGKRLEEIDLIKTYIFSKLDESSYATYLNKWGELIIRTKDNLYDYLYNYIKAYISFYRQNISVENFKTICKRDLLNYFKVSDEAEALKCLLDDMYNKVDYYNMLSSADEAYKIVKTKKFRFFYRVFTYIAYQHPKALFLRTLIEYQEGKISKEDVTNIVSDTIGFMIKFLSISDRGSRDAITMFAGIMNETYANGIVSSKTVSNYVASELLTKDVTPEKLKSSLDGMDAYEQNKKIAVVLLSMYESTTKDDGKVKTSYDQAFTLLDSFSDSFSLDHLLVQTPDHDSNEFCYYKDESSGKLVLKEGHDFPESVAAGMDYELFTKMVLNRIGNLRIYYRDKNSGRQNSPIELKEYPNFYHYSDVINRSADLTNVIIDDCLPLPDIDLTKLKTNEFKKTEAALPKMDKLIEYGLIKPGDEIYITQNPERSKATLLDDKNVLFNGETITLNEWGCRVTGWKSIRIYAYTSIVGEDETLQDKRLRYIRDNNESGEALS